MNRFHRRIVESVRYFSPLLDLAETGMSPLQVKGHLLRVLGTYVEQPDALLEIDVGLLAPEAVRIMGLRSDAWAHDAFRRVLAIYRSATLVDEAVALETCAAFYPDVDRAIAEFSHLFLFEVDKSDLPLDAFRYEVFRNLGGLIESVMQPFLRLLLAQSRVTRTVVASTDAIKRLSLGNVVGELCDTMNLLDVLAPPPWGVRVNQWRNIAQHHRSTTRGDRIIAWYGDSANEQELVFTKRELVNATLRLQALNAALGAARSIFILENAEKLRPLVPAADPSEDVRIFGFSAAIATQGFEVTEFCSEGNHVVVAVRDVGLGPADHRMIHASQFLYPVWTAVPRATVELTYIDRSGRPRAVFGVTSEQCLAVQRGERPIEYIAEVMTIQLCDGPTRQAT